MPRGGYNSVSIINMTGAKRPSRNEFAICLKRRKNILNSLICQC